MFSKQLASDVTIAELQAMLPGLSNANWLPQQEASKNGMGNSSAFKPKDPLALSYKLKGSSQKLLAKKRTKVEPRI